MAASPVYFDDKSVQMFVTPDKQVHRFYPGIVPEEVPNRKLYHDKEKQQLIGEAAAIDQGTHVLYYQPFTTAEKTFSAHGTQRHLYWYEPVGKVLTPIIGAKFPDITFDKHTGYVHLHYWANVAAGTGVVGQQPVVGLEPYDELTGDVTDYQRVMCFARGQLYACWVAIGEGEGDPTYEPTYIFDAPQIVQVPEVWNPDNAAEPVLDIHPPGKGGLDIFDDYAQIDTEEGGNVYGSSVEKIYEDWAVRTSGATAKQLFISFKNPPIYDITAILLAIEDYLINGSWDSGSQALECWLGPYWSGGLIWQNNVRMSLIKKPMAAGSGGPAALDFVTWANAHHETPWLGTHGALYDDVDNFLDLTYNMHGAYITVNLPGTAPSSANINGSALHGVSQGARGLCAYVDEPAFGLPQPTQEFYGVHIYFYNNHQGGLFVDPTAVPGAPITASVEMEVGNLVPNTIDTDRQRIGTIMKAGLRGPIKNDAPVSPVTA